METMYFYEKEFERAKARRREIKKQLSRMPAGALGCRRREYGMQYMRYYQEDGGYVRQGITRDESLLNKMAMKAALDAELERLEKYIQALQGLLKTCKGSSSQEILEEMKRKYPTLPEQYFLSREAIDFKAYADSGFRQSRYKPEDRIHTTSTGLMVRSKGEVTICERLWAHGVPFRYEELIPVGNRFRAPDFSIDTRTKIIRWEHGGMMGNEEYIEDHNRKLLEYQSVGIVPWDNLILTYDEPDGSINIRFIDDIIKDLILPLL